MSAALPHPELISQDSSNKRTYRTIVAQYGNGYSQRAGDGINNLEETWSVRWDNITSTEYSTIVTALDAAAGTDFFTWQAPGDSVTKKWIVSEFTRQALAGSIYSVSAELKRVYDL